MKTLIVDRKSWSDCFFSVYDQKKKDSMLLELMIEQHGIINWREIDHNHTRITFTDENKAVYWLLRWA